VLLLLAGPAGAQKFGYGRAPTPEEIKGWDIDVRGSDGEGLPPGQGTVAEGEALWTQQCAVCHGDFGEGNGRMPVIAGGNGTLDEADPNKTVGSYWPYAATAFDYIRRAMPLTAPQSLTDDETYALVAYILNMNDLLPADATLDADLLRRIEMPNKDGFLVGDPRPDVRNEPCMRDCKPTPVKITSDLAARLGVTPKQGE
jgi:cytochrome c